MPVSKPSKDRLIALWESGVRLDFAWVMFAPTFSYFHWLALRTHPTNEANISGQPGYEKLKSWLPKTWEARQRKLEIITRNLRIWLLQEIHAGSLWAIGFRTLENGDDERARIPRQLFFVDQDGELTPPNKIAWDKGELTTTDATYFDILVVRAPPTIDESVAPTSGVSKDPRDHSNSVATQKKARRSKRQARSSSKKSHRKKVLRKRKTRPIVIRAFLKLWSTKPEFRKLPVKSMVPEVRAEILGDDLREEERSGFHTSSMTKIIGHKLSAVRNRKIRNKPNKP